MLNPTKFAMTDSFYKVILIGGTGYIGSYNCGELFNAGIDVTVFDNYCNSYPLALAGVEQITDNKATLVQGDIRDSSALESALRSSVAKVVINFAELKYVGGSVEKPLANYENNVADCLNLLQFF